MSKIIRPPNKVSWALLISILAFCLRLYLAYHGPIEFDEPVYINNAIEFSQAIRQFHLSPILNSNASIEHPQLQKLVYALGLLPGQPVPLIEHNNAGAELDSVPGWQHLLALRAISAFLGAAAVFLLCLIHPLAGLCLAINTFAVKYTSVIYLEGLPALASLAAVMAANQALHAYRQQASQWRRWGGWLALSALALGATAASKYIYAAVGIAIVIFAILQEWQHKAALLTGLAAWGLLSLVFFFLLDPILWHAPLSRLAASIQFNVNYSAGQHVAEVGYPFWQPLKWLALSIPQQTGDPTAFFDHPNDFLVQLDPLICAFALLGLPAFFRKHKLMFIWLVVGLAFLLIWNTKWPQYILLVLAPFCLSAAYGVNTILAVLAKLRPRRL